MRLTKQTDYTLRVLIYLGTREGKPATIDQVAEAYGISRNHLMKVVHHLATNGILETQRGRGGGFRLARAPKRVGLGKLVRLTEPDFALVECLDPANGECVIDESCRLKGVLREALTAWLGVLDRYTLADLIEPRSELVQLLGLAKGFGDRPAHIPVP
jgi:Rrf2 family nitric oxide-sensitive transcriptional repressor